MIQWPERAQEQTPDATGRPDEPWWTRQAIAWMDEHLTKDMSVVEWGSGASTLWLAARCGQLRSIESDPEYWKWASAALREAGLPSHKYSVELRPLNVNYYEIVQGKYDAAIIDGRMRVACCQRAMRILVPGGILLLDNAERAKYEKARTMLSGWPVIETSNGIWHTNIWIKPNA